MQFPFMTYVGGAYHPRSGGQTTSLAAQDIMVNDIASKSGLANPWALTCNDDMKRNPTR
jgi:hypothetical protein